MREFIYFLKFAFKHQKMYIITGIALMLLNALSPLLLIFIPKLILDAAIGGFQTSTYWFLLVYIACYLIINLVKSNLNYFNGIYGGKLFASFQIDMSAKLLDADISKLESNEFKEQSERAKKYIYADGWGFGYIFGSSLEVVSKVITAVGLIIIIFSFSPLLVALNIILTLVSFKIEGNIKKKEKQDSDARIKHERRTNYYTNLSSDHQYIKDIRLFDYKDTLLDKMRFHYNKNTEFYKKINKRHLKSELISTLFFILQLSLGYYFVINLLSGKSITPGDFTLYIATLTMYTGIMGKIMNKLVYIFSYDMYFQDFKDYMNIPSMSNIDKRSVRAINDNVKFEFINVSFKYPHSESYALRNVNLSFDNKDRIAIVGQNGSGKSTFIKLLMII
jgi:ABC-type bacteriocin/lantibiotic exporter with double-glycine peptidase domain